MAHLVIRHRVANFDSWLPGFQASHAARKQAGFTGHLILRDATDPNLVTAVLAVEDLERAKAFVSSPALHEAMARAGVQGPPDVYFCNDVEEKKY